MRSVYDKMQGERILAWTGGWSGCVLCARRSALGLQFWRFIVVFVVPHPLLSDLTMSPNRPDCSYSRVSLPEKILSQNLACSVTLNNFFLSLFSALDELGDRYLFSMHKLQHLILMMVGPPLLLLGTPDWLIEQLLRHRVVLRLGKVLTHPVVAS